MMMAGNSIERVLVVFSDSHALLSQIDVPSGTVVLHASPTATPDFPNNANGRHQSQLQRQHPWEDHDMIDTPPELSYTPTTATPPELDEGYSYYADWPYDAGAYVGLAEDTKAGGHGKRKHDDEDPAYYGAAGNCGLAHVKRVHITPRGLLHRVRQNHQPLHFHNQQSHFTYQQQQQQRQPDSLDTAIKRALGQYGRLDLVISAPEHLQTLSQTLLPYISANTIIEHGTLLPATNGTNGTPTGVLLVVDEGEQEEEDWPAARAAFGEAARELGCRVQAVTRLGMQC
jgi:hypothetical protein